MKPAPKPTPADPIEAAVAASDAALSEGAPLIVAGMRKVGVAFFWAAEAEALSGKARKAGANVAPRAGLTRVGVEQLLQAAIERSYSKRDTSSPWGESFRLTIAPRDCVEP